MVRLGTAATGGGGGAYRAGEPPAPGSRYRLLMRVFALALAACLLVGPLAGPGAASTADLVVQVDGLVKAFPGDAGVYVGDPLAPQPLYAHEADVVFIAPSLYKLGILAHAESLVDAGKLKYTDTVEIQPED